MLSSGARHVAWLRARADEPSIRPVMRPSGSGRRSHDRNRSGPSAGWQRVAVVGARRVRRADAWLAPIRPERLLDLKGLTWERSALYVGARRAAGLSLIPPYVVERWWRGRERRQDERPLVLPE